MSRPKRYGTFQDFQREELGALNKIGFCVDDLEYEAAYKPHTEEADDEPDELDFG
ncbi:MAG: hypothetical protein MJD61_18910 [Proteobacteria bacterium]|nr:hypothetical protein [Pseudomonadota bacterium]